MLVLYGRLTFQPACVFRGLNKGLNCVWLSFRYTARGTQQPVPEGTTHIPRVRALIRSRMYGFAKSHPEGLATRTKLRLLSERPSQAQGPQSSARRRSTRNPLPSSDKSAGRILKCPKDGALSSSPASPPSPVHVHATTSPIEAGCIPDVAVSLLPHPPHVAQTRMPDRTRMPADSPACRAPAKRQQS